VKKLYSLQAILLFATLFLLVASGTAQVVQGKITDPDNAPMPFASVYVAESSYGVTSNLKGQYFLELPAGEHEIVFSFVGYESVRKVVVVSPKKSIELNVVLNYATAQIRTVEIVADERDRGTTIIKEAMDRRKDYNSLVQQYSCKTYAKTSLEKTKVISAELDSLAQHVSVEQLEAANLLDHFKKQNLNLIEVVSTTYFKAPGRYKEIVEAYHDYVRGPESREVNRQMSASFTADIGPDHGDLAPKQYSADNPYLLYEDMTSSELNFYDNLIDFPQLTQKPLLSPIASTGLLSYKYYYDGAFLEKGKTVFRIRVEPRFRNEALFEGFVFIEDGSYALLGVDLKVNSEALLFCRDFSIIQNYEQQPGGQYVPVRREFTYTIKEGKTYILGSTRVDHSDYDLETELKASFFGAEIKRYVPAAFERDSSYWQVKRPITLSEKELRYIQESDSVSDYFNSDDYFRRLDSAFNRVDWLTPLAGYGRRNRAKGNELYVQGILGQVNPFGIGGYRHRLPASFNKTFDNGLQLENDFFVDYGFRNKDVKGRLKTGFTYVPEKFVKTSVWVGDYYELINSYASIEQTFSRSNYVRNRTGGISQSMEIVNGLYGEVAFEYSDQQGINNLELSKWSGVLFGELNEPIEFNRYVKSELQVKLKYRFHQEFVMKGKRKIVIGTNYPEVDFTYKKGLNGVFGSEVDYDYIEFNVYDDIQMARFGYSQWSATAGTYLSKDNLRVLEHRYFRGSDKWFFSNPVYSLQLLGPTLHTPNEFLQANFIHHFEGSILNKVPLLNRLKLQLAAGAGTLVIPDSDFAHAEVFAGLERVIRIKDELFRLSVFAVTSDNSFDTAQMRFKFGISFYNTFTQRWDN
jgi:hypothetical protein